jgi:hypothetical protein
MHCPETTGLCRKDLGLTYITNRSCGPMDTPKIGQNCYHSAIKRTQSPQ